MKLRKSAGCALVAWVVDPGCHGDGGHHVRGGYAGAATRLRLVATIANETLNELTSGL